MGTPPAILYLQIIGLVISLITGLGTLIALFKVQELHVHLNSRLTELLQARSEAEHRRGVADGVEQERIRPRAIGPNSDAS